MRQVLSAMRLITLVSLIASTFRASAGESMDAEQPQQRIIVRECLNRSYGKQLVSYPIAAKEGACLEAALRLSGPTGPVAAQLSDIEYWPGDGKFIKSARLSFIVDELKPTESLDYTLEYDSSKPVAASSGFQVKREKSHVEIDTGKIGVRLSLGSSALADGASASKAPGLLTGMRFGGGG